MSTITFILIRNDGINGTLERRIFFILRSYNFQAFAFLMSTRVKKISMRNNMKQKKNPLQGGHSNSEKAATSGRYKRLDIATIRKLEGSLFKAFPVSME